MRPAWKLARQARKGTTAAWRLIGTLLARGLIQPEDEAVWLLALSALNKLADAEAALDFLCDRTAPAPRKGGAR
jgi:hypothetical protein